MSGKSDRRQEEKEKRILDIKDSAWRIFLRDGFYGSKLADVAKDCRLGLSSLYYYFQDKRQLVYLLMTDFKLEVNRKQLELIQVKQISYRDFIIGFIHIYLEDLEKFKFFVAADTYYNYNKQYDLSDPILERYDTQTRQDGNLILKLLSGNDAIRYEQIHVCLAMVLGFLRRLALLSEYDWPTNEKYRKDTFQYLEQLSVAMLQEIGLDPDDRIELV